MVKLKDFGVRFVNSIIAGIMIGIAGTVYLQTDKSIFGTVLFSFGLITIICQGLELFTGKISYISIKELSHIPNWIIGNFIGTYIVANLLKFTRVGSDLIMKAQAVWEVKRNDSYLSLFILAIFCGMLMYLATNTGTKLNRDDVSRLIVIALPVIIFILCGFEHSIADMFYLNLGFNFKNFLKEDIIKIILILIGNGLGGKVIPSVRELISK